jgi:putative FmdB family regulatory protein
VPGVAAYLIAANALTDGRDQMPLYEYECDACHHRFEVIQKFSDPLVDTCPKCGGPVHKRQSAPAIQFKGSGFYITDYAKKEHTAAAKADQAEGGKADTSDKAGKADKSDKSEKSEKSEKTERSDTSEKPGRSETPAKTEKSSGGTTGDSAASSGSAATKDP